jgi:hypothetical protein
MIFISGSTRCVFCNQIMFLMEDICTIENFKGMEMIPDFFPGIYHYTCFLKTSFLNEYIVKKEQIVRLDLQNHLNDWPIIHCDDNFGLIYNRFTREYRLFFFKHGRDFIFHKKELLASLLKSLKTETKTLTGPADQQYFFIEKTKSECSIFHKAITQCKYTFSLKGFNALSNQMSLLANREKHSRVNIWETCQQLGIMPIKSSCPLEQAVGYILGSSFETEIGPVDVAMGVEKFSQIKLTLQQKDLLLEFLTEATARVEKDHIEQESFQ